MHIPQARIPSDLHWVQIPEFPNYSVSHAGHVRNDRFDRLLNQFINQSGLVYVGLCAPNRQQHKRSVPLMVACAFLQLPALPFHRATFDTPINVDGNRQNNHVDNLLWRPRWFAVAYHLQVDRPARIKTPIRDLATGDIFASSLHAAMTYGLLDKDVARGVWEDIEIWPTRHRFTHA